MPFVPTKHATAGYIDKPYKAILEQLANKHGRGVKKELEHIILAAAKADNIILSDEI